MSKAEGVHSTRAPARAPFRSIVPNPTVYLEPSPASADGGHMIGKLPSAIDAADLRGLSHPENPVRAIRAKCIDCSGGDASETRKCVFVGCTLWPFRMGGNPFRKPASEARRTAARSAIARNARAGQKRGIAPSLISDAGLPATNPHPEACNAKPSDTEGRS